MVEKFNYQIVFKIEETERVVFAGTTSTSISDLILDLCETYNFSENLIENLVYQPVNSSEDGTKKTS